MGRFPSGSSMMKRVMNACTNPIDLLVMMDGPSTVSIYWQVDLLVEDVQALRVPARLLDVSNRAAGTRGGLSAGTLPGSLPALGQACRHRTCVRRCERGAAACHNKDATYSVRTCNLEIGFKNFKTHPAPRRVGGECIGSCVSCIGIYLYLGVPYFSVVSI